MMANSVALLSTLSPGSTNNSDPARAGHCLEAPNVELLMTVADRASPFYVPVFLDLLGACAHRFTSFWVGLGRLESKQLADDLKTVRVTMPVYVAGLARSGSTILHEMLASHPGVATHRLKDYPLVYTPFWWRQATARFRPTAARERAHQDRILIAPDSPDALEEMVWMAFFPRCHDPANDNRLDGSKRNAAFEGFYAQHVRKLLLAECAERYAAKANYHVGRLAYLASVFPDARFIIPVRAPATHIGSLMRQQQRFSAGQRNNSRALAFMQRSGHFEFGLDRRPINLGDTAKVQAIQRAWATGEEVLGWALYWDMVYSYLAGLLDGNAQLRSMAKVVRYEELCAFPEKTIRALCEHCRLNNPDSVVGKFAGAIRAPDYYESPLSLAQRSLIDEVTSTTARRWGYQEPLSRSTFTLPNSP
jgi:Sulfotransferase family